MAIATLTIDVTAKLASLERDMGKAAHIAEKNAKRMESAFSAAGKSLAAMGAALSVGAFAGMVRGVADAGDQLQKLSTKTGLAVEELSKLQYSASLSDLSSEDLGASLIKLNKVMGEAANGSKEASDALARFGIAPKSGMSAIEAFSQIADKVKATGDETKIASGLNDVFGKSFASLIPLLKGGSSGLKENADELERMGGVMSGELARASESFNDNLTKIGRSLDALKVSSLSGVISGLERMTTQMLQAASAAGSLAKGLGLWMTVSGKENDNPGKAVSELTEKIEKLKKTRDELSKPTLANKINDVVFGDVLDINKQLSFLTTKRDLLKSMQATQALANTGYGNEGRGKTGITDDGIKDASPKPPKPPKGVKAAKAAKEEPYSDVLTPAAEAYAKAIENINAAISGADKSMMGMNESQQALYDLMISPEWQSMPDTWKEVAISQAEAGTAAIKTKEDYLKLKELIDATPTAKLEEMRKTMVFLESAFKAGSISAEQFSEAATAALGAIPDSAKEATNAMEEFSKQAARNMQDAFADFLFDPFKNGIDGMLQSFGDMIKKMVANAVAADLSSRIFGKAGGGEGSGLLGAGLDWLKGLVPNANGGVYSAPSLSAYSGSVISRPTVFPFAKGIGLMGEAGAEAILPLTRGANGKLGVSAQGGGGHTINVYVNGTSAPDVRRSAGQGAREALGLMDGARRYA